MELLSRFLLIMGLLMISWHWAESRSPPLVPTPAVIHQGNSTTTPNINNTDFLVQSIFDILPTCREGEIRTGKRCHRIA